MTHRMQYRKLLGLAGAACAILMLCQARAQSVDVTPTVTFANGLYHYDYSIFNDTAEELAIVSIGVLPGPNTVLNPTAPTGYQASYDSGLGIVDFLPELGAGGFDPGSTVNGFLFDSPIPPGQSSFSALTASGVPIMGITQAPVPEPQSLALLGAAAAVSTVALRRRRPTRR
ncbi:MAG TPA: PEP-CTERM sorting domain-containing protein [Chthonomonadaceae bacterium]|nr:PEP-CTERM sorting domain-containing protein [Chthonomonadaceae bacterium]